VTGAVEDQPRDTATLFAEYRRVIKRTKRAFFDKRIKEVSVDKGRPWDLMPWVKAHQLPTHEAVSYQDQPLVTLDLLWDGLHSTYNSASGRAVDFSVLDELGEGREPREWSRFSMAELLEALKPTLTDPCRS